MKHLLLSIEYGKFPKSKINWLGGTFSETFCSSTAASFIIDKLFNYFLTFKKNSTILGDSIERFISTVFSDWAIIISVKARYYRILVLRVTSFPISNFSIQKIP